MKLSPYELVFGQKSKKSIVFNLSSTRDSFGNCKLSPNSPCNSFPKHKHLGLHPQMKKLQKRNSAHWFLNRERKHSVFYNEVQVYLNQNKHFCNFLNCRFRTAQPLKINTYVLTVNKTTQIGISKKIQP